jgi:ActR/RegA family two-component response regulator
MVVQGAVADHEAVPGTVLIVDDNARFRLRARRWLEADGYSVVAEARDGASALEGGATSPAGHRVAGRRPAGYERAVCGGAPRP